jgi:hypothetical protein
MDGWQDWQQRPAKSTKRRVLTAIAIVVGILVVSALLDLLMVHQGATPG